MAHLLPRPSVRLSLCNLQKPTRSRAFSTTGIRSATPFFMLAARSQARETQHFSKVSGLSVTNHSPAIEAIKASEVDPFVRKVASSKKIAPPTSLASLWASPQVEAQKPSRPSIDTRRHPTASAKLDTATQALVTAQMDEEVQRLQEKIRILEDRTRHIAAGHAGPASSFGNDAGSGASRGGNGGDRNKIREERISKPNQDTRDRGVGQRSLGERIRRSAEVTLLLLLGFGGWMAYETYQESELAFEVLQFQSRQLHGQRGIDAELNACGDKKERIALVDARTRAAMKQGVFDTESKSASTWGSLTQPSSRRAAKIDSMQTSAPLTDSLPSSRSKALTTPAVEKVAARNTLAPKSRDIAKPDVTINVVPLQPPRSSWLSSLIWKSA